MIKKNIDFIGKKNIFIALSIIVIIIGLAGIITKGGLRYGIDFTGGIRVMIETRDEVTLDNLDTLRTEFADKNIGEQIQTFGENKGLIISSAGTKLSDAVVEKIYDYRTQVNNKIESINELDAPLSDYETLKIFDKIKGLFRVGAREGRGDERYDINLITRAQLERIIQNALNEGIADNVNAVLKEFYEIPENRISLNQFQTQDDLKNELITKSSSELTAEIMEKAKDGITEFNELSGLFNSYGIAALRLNTFFLLREPTIADRIQINLNTASFDEINPVITRIFTEELNISEFLNYWEEQLRQTKGLLTPMDGFNTRAPRLPEKISSVLKENFFVYPYSIQSVEVVGPRIGGTMRSKALQAVFWALIGMLIYITWRFEFKYAMGAIAALIHDVLITVSILAFLNMEFDISVIAAILTIIGYSLNDTIIIYDRIRENTKLIKNDFPVMVNESLNQTLSRTVITSLTTLIAVVCLYVLGGEVIRTFSFTLLIGVVVGTYSSLFIASPVLIEWKRMFEQPKKKKK